MLSGHMLINLRRLEIAEGERPHHTKMEAKVRQRGNFAPKSYNNDDNEEYVIVAKDQKERKDINLLYWVVVIVIHAVVFVFEQYKHHSFPAPLDSSSAGPLQFSEGRAREFLFGLTYMGSRPTGSKENEDLAVSFLLKELNRIKDSRNAIHNIDIVVQKVTGNFSLNFLDGFTNCYENVQNIIARIGPKNEPASDSLLVNCHFDSVIGGPGVSDDAISCALMLETLQVMSQRSAPINNSIIFLFNGAEENILQASHGFITQHEWAADVRAFVNLEAAGAGGREMLFQAGPGHPWLIHTYAAHAPHPFASVVGQEVFGSGVIPSDTDYRIYRDYGNIPGVDIAYMTNGYVYHTVGDSMEMIPPGCIQRGGENLLAVVTGISQSPLLRDPGSYRHGSLVFLDILGYFMLVIPARIAFIINLVTVLAVIAKISTGRRRRELQHIATSVLILLLSWLASLVAVVIVAVCLDAVRPLTWFTNTWLIVPLYVCPALAAVLSLHVAVEKYRSRQGPVRSAYSRERDMYEAQQCVWSVLLLLMTYHRLCSSILLLLWLLPQLLVRDAAARVGKLSLREHPGVFTSLHVVSTLPGLLVLLPSLHACLVMFIPLMGRTGAGVMPDTVIGGLVALAVIVTSSPHAGMVCVSGGVRQLLTALMLAFSAAVILATVTPLGFPYSANVQQPTRQRHIIHHISRTFHDAAGDITRQDSGFLHVPFDRVGVSGDLTQAVPQLQSAQPATCQGVYCGWPFYLPLMSKLKKLYYIPAPPPQVTPRAQLSLVSKTQVTTNIYNLTFSVSGPHHLNIYIEPHADVELSRWSLDTGVPYRTVHPSGEADRPLYFVYYAYGLQPNGPFQFWFLAQTTKAMDSKDSLIDIALGAHYLTVDEDGNKHTPPLSSYLQSFPDWTVPIGWAATYHSWTF